MLKPEQDAPLHDKIRWLNYYDLTMLKVLCANKITAKNYATTASAGLLKVAKTYAIFDKAEQLDFSDHPSTFLIKRSSGCAKNIFVTNKDRLDMDKVKKYVSTWDTKVVCGFESKEFQYSLSEPRIFTEENLLDGRDLESLIDYRFWTFNGKVQFVAVNDGRGWGAQVFYDTSFNKMDLFNKTHLAHGDEQFEKPLNFDLMVALAEKLAKPFKFVRVDLYNLNGEIYLGEFTFSPGGYRTRFVNSVGRSLDVELGKRLLI